MTEVATSQPAPRRATLAPLPPLSTRNAKRLFIKQFRKQYQKPRYLRYTYRRFILAQ